MYHGIQRPFVKGNIHGFGGDLIQLAHVGVHPGDALQMAVLFGHVVHDDRGEVDANLIPVTFPPKIFGYRLSGHFSPCHLAMTTRHGKTLRTLSPDPR